MKSIKVVSIVDGQPFFDKPISELLSQCEAGSVIQLLTPVEYIGLQQIRWWKGVLLPALAKDTGDSIGYWETKLKLEVMPDEFTPFYVPMGKQVFPVVPSISKLSVKKMNIMIEGAVAYCRDECKLDWVVLPDPDLRK